MTTTATRTTIKPANGPRLIRLLDPQTPVERHTSRSDPEFPDDSTNDPDPLAPARGIGWALILTLAAALVVVGWLVAVRLWGLAPVAGWTIAGIAALVMVAAAFQPVLAPKYGRHNLAGRMDPSRYPDPFRPGQDPLTRGE